MPVTRLMFIRHAEKPAEGDCGVTAHTKLDTESLTPRGWQRAGALVGFFAPQLTVKGRNGLMPDVVFAAGVGPGSKSARAADLMDRSGIALVAWEHKEVPSVIKKPPRAPTVPKVWPDDRFDMGWIPDRQVDGWHFHGKAAAPPCQRPV
jgi:hypothetical protein